MIIKAEDKVTGDGCILVRGQVLVIELGDLVQVGKLAESSEEVIGRNGGLTLEESEPENLGALSLEDGANFGGQVVVHDVLEVDLVQVISPWVQNGESLVLYALRTILHNVRLEELKVSLIGVDRVLEVFGDDRLLLVTNKRANSLNARARLQVLRLNLHIEHFCDFLKAFNAQLAQDTNEDLLETLKVPVLVNAGVDDARVEDLLGLHGKQVA